MQTKFTIITLLVMCFLFSLVSLSFGQDMTFEEKQKEKADYDQTYGDIKSNHHYYPFSPDVQLTEDFESGTWPPAGWTEYHTGIDALDESTAQSYSPTHSAFFDDVSGVDSSWFVITQITALEANANVTFWQYQYYPTYYIYHAIWISTGSPDPAVGDYVVVQETGVGTPSTWEEITVDLSAYAGQDVYVAFVYAGNFADNWYLDDITIGAPAAVPNPATIVAPLDGAIDVSSLASLEWASGGGSPAGFKIFFGTDGGGTTPPTSIENGTDLGNVLLYSPASALAYNTTYYWQIIPYNAGGDAVGCPIWSFTTMADPTITSFPWTEDFENGGVIPAGWVNDPNDSGKDWTFGTSAGHGAGFDHTTGTGYFAYLDDSSPNPTDPSNLLTPPLDLTGLANPEIEFYYWSFMDGGTATPGYMFIDVYDGVTWHVGVDSIGQETAEWKSKKVNLAAYSSTATVVRFSVYETTSFYHDIGIDDAIVKEAPTTPIFTVVPDSGFFGTISTGDTSSYTTFTVTNDGIGTITVNPATALTGTDPGEFVLVDNNVYPVALAAGASMTVDVSFAPTSIGAKTANLTITDDLTDIIHDVPLFGNGVFYAETFESFTVAANATGYMNGWSADPTATTAAFRWNVDAGGTPSSATGPLVDHTTGTAAGIYLFTEASSGAAGDTAFVYGAPVDISTLTVPYMSFWYHMVGADMGDMHLDVSTDGGATWTLDVMTPLIGAQQSAQADPWLVANVDMGAFAGQTVEVRFRAIKGASFGGDMAIDDVSMFDAQLGNIDGTVTAAVSGTPIPDAVISIGGKTDTTDAAGFYSITNLLAGTYDVTCTHPVYTNATATGVMIYENLTTTQDFALLWADIAVAPDSFTVALNHPDTYETTMTITNTGPGDLTYSSSINWLTDEDGQQAPFKHLPISMNYPKRDEEPSTALDLGNNSSNHKKYPESVGDLLRGSNAWFKGGEYSVYFYGTFDTDTPGDMNEILSPPAWNAYCGDYDAVHTGFFYVNEPTEFNTYIVDAATGVATLLGSTGLAGQLNGMACDKTTGIMYGVDSNNLYTIDLTTGAATLVGPIGNTGLMLTLACDGSGNLYGIDLQTDSLSLIDKVTGTGTPIGPTGFDCNYAQSMNWDPLTNLIYWAAYSGGLDGNLRVVDPITGGSTYIGDFEGGREVTVLAFPGAGDTWLSITNNASGVVPSGSSVDVGIKFDATGLAMVTKTADIVVSNNALPTTDDDVVVPVKLDAGAPVTPGIVINEIMYNPIESGTDSTEYIEFYNKENVAVDMSGWMFTQGVDHTFPAGTMLNPGDYLTISVDTAAMDIIYGPIANLHQWTSGALSNGGEDIVIVDTYGFIVDTVMYDDAAPWPTEPDGNGPSLELIHPNLDNNDGSNWAASDTSTAPIGTPGEENSTLEPQIVSFNAPRALNAVAGDAVVDLDWLAPLPAGELGYDDGGSETGLGFSTGGELAVRFTPNVYPSKLLAIKTYWANITDPLDNVEYSIWSNPAGGGLAPSIQLVPNTPDSVELRGDFSEEDISAYDITINQGDFFFSWNQPDTINYGIGVDNTANAGRSWASFDGGASWLRLDQFGFYNVMIRALVQEGTGTEARIVELTPTMETIDPTTVKQMRRESGHLFEIATQKNGIVGDLSKKSIGAAILDTLQGYEVWRSEDDITYNSIATTDTFTLIYSDNTVVNGTDYWYYVTADYAGGASNPSNVAMATPLSVAPVPFFDDFEAYTAGTQLVVQNPNDWTTWSGTPGTGEDPIVSDAFAFSGSNSVLIVQNNDLVKTFGELTSGAWEISFQVYIPTGQAGYFNTLAGFTPNPFNWGMECYFDVGGGGRVLGGSATAVAFAFAYDTWQEAKVMVDLDSDWAQFYFDGAMVHEWQWTLGASGGGSALQMDANDFFGATANDQMYFDDYNIELVTPREFFDDFEAYTAGTQLVVQNPVDWTTWSGTSGGADDPLVSDAQAFSGSNSVLIVQNNDLVKVLESAPITSGQWKMSFEMYIPTGQAGYFNTMSQVLVEWAMQVFFDVGGTGRLDAGGASAATFSYAYDTWQLVEVRVDLDNDLAQFLLDGSVVYTWQYTLGTFGTPTIQLQLDANNFFGLTADDQMYFDDYYWRADTTIVTGIDDQEIGIPQEFALYQNYPNPFNPTTTIKYDLKQTANVSLRIYNILGQEVRTLVNTRQEAGYKTIVWDGLNNYGSRVASGVYIYRIDAGEFVKAKKMILMK